MLPPGHIAVLLQEQRFVSIQQNPSAATAGQDSRALLTILNMNILWPQRQEADTIKRLQQQVSWLFDVGHITLGLAETVDWDPYIFCNVHANSANSRHVGAVLQPK